MLGLHHFGADQLFWCEFDRFFACVFRALILEESDSSSPLTPVHIAQKDDSSIEPVSLRFAIASCTVRVRAFDWNRAKHY